MGGGGDLGRGANDAHAGIYATQYGNGQHVYRGVHDPGSDTDDPTFSEYCGFIRKHLDVGWGRGLREWNSRPSIGCGRDCGCERTGLAMERECHAWLVLLEWNNMVGAKRRRKCKPFNVSPLHCFIRYSAIGLCGFGGSDNRIQGRSTDRIFLRAVYSTRQ